MIREIGNATEDGFGNLRLAAIANCPPGIPFFPAGYHDGQTWTLSIALQSADIVADAVSGDDELMAALGRVSSALQACERELQQLVALEARRLDIQYLVSIAHPRHSQRTE